MQIDLNADLGEGAGFDAELMPLVTSANICCGLHAGDPAVISATLELAVRHGATIGAHPGYADREHFGRRDFAFRPDDVVALVAYQLGALSAIASLAGQELKYVKPHGALYNQACRDQTIAEPFVVAVEHFGLSVVALPGSRLEAACQRRGLQFIPEGFADRRYRPDGSLVPRSEPDAFVHDPAEAVEQVERLVREYGVRSICVHGDNPDAVSFTQAVRSMLLERNFTLQPAL